MSEMKVMKSHNRAIIVETFLRGNMTEPELKEAMQLYSLLMVVEASK